MKYILTILVSTVFAFANTNSKDDAVKAEATHVAAPAFANLEPKDWIGEEFIILPLAPSQQQYGYNHLRSPVGGYIVPTNDEVSGKTGTVTEVNIPGRGDWEVRMQIHDEEKIVTAVSSTGSFPNLARKADFDIARTRWMGDTLWTNENMLSSYDIRTDKFVPVPLLRLSPVVADSVGLGWGNSRPIRFHVHALSGESGFLDIHVSNTNIAPEFREEHRFTDMFFETDPRSEHDWSVEVWTAISKGQVATGMTPEQVKFSWGEPAKTEQTFEENNPSVSVTETWWYGKSELRFEHGILKSFSE